MHREKEELVDGPYRRDFLTYDNHILDGEIFLQVSLSANENEFVEISINIF